MELEKDEALQETIAILETIPGGRAVIDWFGGWPEFGDAEVLQLCLVRRGQSILRVSAKVSEAGKWRGPPFKHAAFDFTLRDMIDVYLDGFSHQNVMGGLTLHRAQNHPLHPSLVGTGLTRGEVEIELGPCFGTHGMIRCTIEKIVITPVDHYQEAEASL